MQERLKLKQIRTKLKRKCTKLKRNENIMGEKSAKINEYELLTFYILKMGFFTKA